MFGEGRKIVQKSADRWRCNSNVRGKTKNGFIKHKNVVSSAFLWQLCLLCACHILVICISPDNENPYSAIYRQIFELFFFLRQTKFHCLTIVLLKYQVILTSSFKIIDFWNRNFNYNHPVYLIENNYFTFIEL